MNNDARPSVDTFRSDWRNLPGTRILRLRYADRPSLQGADEDMDFGHEAGELVHPKAGRE